MTFLYDTLLSHQDCWKHLYTSHTFPVILSLITENISINKIKTESLLLTGHKIRSISVQHHKISIRMTYCRLLQYYSIYPRVQFYIHWCKLGQIFSKWFLIPHTPTDDTPFTYHPNDPTLIHNIDNQRICWRI